jgi:hypothetical protein
MTVTGDEPVLPRALTERVKNILMRPKAEWAVIDAEPATVQGLYRNYICILAAIGPVCSVIGGLVFGAGAGGFSYRPSILTLLGSAIVSYVLSLGWAYVMALVLDWLAPRFDGQASRIQAMKVAAYAPTAGWLVGVFALVPWLAPLAILGLYSLYLLAVGGWRLMGVPEGRSVGFTLAVIGVMVLIAIAVAIILTPFGLLWAL